MLCYIILTDNMVAESEGLALLIPQPVTGHDPEPFLHNLSP